MSTTTPTAHEQTRILVQTAAQVCEEKKGEDTRILELDPIDSGLSDFFLITSATNDRQAIAIADEIEFRLKKEFGVYPTSVEGRRKGDWILLDYVDFVVHVFLAERRAFYDIERLRKSARPVTPAEFDAGTESRPRRQNPRRPGKSGNQRQISACRHGPSGKGHREKWRRAQTKPARKAAPKPKRQRQHQQNPLPKKPLQNLSANSARQKSGNASRTNSLEAAAHPAARWESACLHLAFPKSATEKRDPPKRVPFVCCRCRLEGEVQLPDGCSGQSWYS